MPTKKQIPGLGPTAKQLLEQPGEIQIVQTGEHKRMMDLEAAASVVLIEAFGRGGNLTGTEEAALTALKIVAKYRGVKEI